MARHLCIIQLSDTINVIKTIQSVCGIRKKHLDIFLTLIVKESVGRSLEFLFTEYFHRVVFVDYKNFLDKNLERIRERVLLFLDDIQRTPINGLINLSSCPASAYLSSIIESDHKFGLHIDKNNNEVVSGKWAQYMYANVFVGKNSCFSLVDIFKMIIGNDQDDRFIDVRENQNGAIVVHPFASDGRAFWKGQKWIETIYKLAKEIQLNIFIVGSERHIEQAKEIYDSPLIKAFSNKIYNFVGRKKSREVFDILKEASLFIGHNSEVSHLAALARIPTLIAVPESSFSIDILPYGRGIFALVSKTERSDISYQAVFSVAEKLLSNGIEIDYSVILEKSSDFYFVKTDIYKGLFSTIGKYQIAKLSSDIFTKKEAIDKCYRIAWQYIFENVQEYQALPKILPETNEEFNGNLEGLRHIYSLCSFGQKYACDILKEVSKNEPNISFIKNHSNKIDEIDMLLGVVAKTFPLLAPLVNYAAVRKSNLLGENIVELSESVFILYRELGNLSSVIFELLEKVVLENINDQKRIDI